MTRHLILNGSDNGDYVLYNELERFVYVGGIMWHVALIGNEGHCIHPLLGYIKSRVRVRQVKQDWP